MTIPPFRGEAPENVHNHSCAGAACGQLVDCLFVDNRATKYVMSGGIEGGGDGGTGSQIQ